MSSRAALFVFVGVAVFAHWVVTDPTYDEDALQTGWWYVLAFSGVVAVIGIGTLVVGRFVGCGAQRSSFGAAVGAGIASVANIFEDGLEMGWAFFATILGTGVLLIGLLATAAMTALRGTSGRRRLALVPLGTALAIVLYVEAGGPIMLATWLLAAALIVSMSRSLQPLDQPRE